MKKTVLIVDDLSFMRSTIEEIINKTSDLEVIGKAAYGNEATDMAFELESDIITLDNILPDMLGLEILDVFQGDEMPAKVLMVSAVGQTQVIEEAMNKGATGYLVKLFTEKQLIKEIEALYVEQP